MNIEIHKPELVQRLNEHIQTGHFPDAAALIKKALDALDEKAPAATPPATAPRRHISEIISASGAICRMMRGPNCRWMEPLKSIITFTACLRD